MSDNRRSFLLKSVGASTAAWLTANWPAQVAAAEKAQAMGAFTFFSRGQAAEVGGEVSETVSEGLERIDDAGDFPKVASQCGGLAFQRLDIADEPGFEVAVIGLAEAGEPGVERPAVGMERGCVSHGVCYGGSIPMQGDRNRVSANLQEPGGRSINSQPHSLCPTLPSTRP